jgi:septum formation protein
VSTPRAQESDRPAAGLLLASASPQRRAILAQVGIAFTVEVTRVEEIASGDPSAVAAENARRKALAPDAPGRLVLGADTVVSAGGRPLGKPRDEGQAREYLTRLSAVEHEVCGGIALVRDGCLLREAVVVTRVAFRALPPSVLDWYVATGEWRERAGGYAIQGAGAALVSGVFGDYLNVVGLPLATLLDLAPELWPARPD